jgi:protease-4
MSGLASSHAGAALLKNSDLARSLLAHSLPEMEAQLRFIDEAINDRSGAPVKTLAYCFCGY